MKRGRIILLVLICGWLAGASRGQGKAADSNTGTENTAAGRQKGYELGTNGTFYLTIPDGWHDSVKRVKESSKLFDSVFLTPADTNGFNCMVEVIGVGGNLTNAEELRLVLVHNGEENLTNCVEKSIKLKSFKGAQAAGEYFRVTDRKFDMGKRMPGDYKYLIQGYVMVGALVASFELVTDDADRDEPLVIGVLKEASFARALPPDAK